MGGAGECSFPQEIPERWMGLFLGDTDVWRTGPSTHIFAFEHFPSFILFGKSLFMFLKCVV